MRRPNTLKESRRDWETWRPLYVLYIHTTYIQYIHDLATVHSTRRLALLLGRPVVPYRSIHMYRHYSRLYTSYGQMWTLSCRHPTAAPGRTRIGRLRPACLKWASRLEQHGRSEPATATICTAAASQNSISKKASAPPPPRAHNGPLLF